MCGDGEGTVREEGWDSGDAEVNWKVSKKSLAASLPSFLALKIRTWERGVISKHQPAPRREISSSSLPSTAAGPPRRASRSKPAGWS